MWIKPSSILSTLVEKRFAYLPKYDVVGMVKLKKFILKNTTAF